ncbi:hypothetical protein FACS1894113_4300 [Alphaproteobacteria bacterium]|nr:hypothetical protein FACS1894113_4300 [Alphaproteobacteria bacterium]
MKSWVRRPSDRPFTGLTYYYALTNLLDIDDLERVKQEFKEIFGNDAETNPSNIGRCFAKILRWLIENGHLDLRGGLDITIEYITNRIDPFGTTVNSLYA